jgi:hypothetical protein
LKKPKSKVKIKFSKTCHTPFLKKKVQSWGSILLFLLSGKKLVSFTLMFSFVLIDVSFQLITFRSFLCNPPSETYRCPICQELKEWEDCLKLPCGTNFDGWYFCKFFFWFFVFSNLNSICFFC